MFFKKCTWNFVPNSKGIFIWGGRLGTGVVQGVYVLIPGFPYNKIFVESAVLTRGRHELEDLQ